PLLLWLDLSDDDPVGREVAMAREAAFRAALATLDGDESMAAKWLRKEYGEMLLQAGSDGDGAASRHLPSDALRQRAVAAARSTISSLRRRGEIGDDAFHRVEEELDWTEL